jgi:hypothetical protein
MGLYELRDMDYDAQLMFAKEYLPLLYKTLEELGEGVAIKKDPNDLSPIMPSFDDNDEPYFTRNGRRVDK